nr:zinc finger protein RFP-like [Pelodiscus sinensis]|eukprot:XP_006118469.1 zinc finger protein RFP-like [Pelodiscus sinensis]
MAAENPARTLQEEATCSICLDYFHEPVMIIDCGHNFCRACITQCQEGWQTNLSCPCCRGSFPQRNLKPNRQLASLAEVAKQLNLQLIKDSGGERVCEKHQEALKLFCQDDQTPICVVCNCSKEHRAHSVVPSEEAAQEYKVEIQSQVEILKKERAEIQVFQSSGEMASQELLQEVEAEKQKVVSEFKQLHLFLEKQEEHRLGQLRELDQEIKKRRDENATKFSTVLSCLGDLVCELEGKCQQPVSEFLQDIRSTLNRCMKGKFQNPAAEPPTWRRRIKELSREIVSLQDAVKKFKETLSPGSTLNLANVTFDPATAHPRFVVSENGKRVRWGDTRQEPPYRPERFDPSRCILGSEGFTAGSHGWVVEVGDGGTWAVGVARESVKRKGEILLDPEGGIWAVGLCRGLYRVLNSPVTPLFVSRNPQRIVVYVKYDVHTVLFFDLENLALLYSFPSAAFAGEKVFPFFRLGDMQTCLRIGP